MRFDASLEDLLEKRISAYLSALQWLLPVRVAKYSEEERDYFVKLANSYAEATSPLGGCVSDNHVSTGTLSTTCGP